MNKHSNLVYMTAILFYAFILWLFFRRRGRNFAEIATAMIFFTAFVSLAYSIVFMPIEAYYKGTAGFYYFTLLGVLLYAIYYTWGFKAFLNYPTLGGSVKVFFCSDAVLPVVVDRNDGGFAELHVQWKAVAGDQRAGQKSGAVNC